MDGNNYEKETNKDETFDDPPQFNDAIINLDEINVQRASSSSGTQYPELLPADNNNEPPAYSRKKVSHHVEGNLTTEVLLAPDESLWLVCQPSSTIG